MTIYLKAEEIKGSVSTKNYASACELLSATVGVQRRVQTHVGSSYNREAGALHHSEMQISKLMDSGSSDLQRYFYSAKVIPKVEIDFCHGDDVLSPKLQYTLHNVLLSGLQDSTRSNGETVETYTLSYTQIEKRYSLKDSLGNLQAPKSIGYKLDTASVM